MCFFELYKIARTVRRQDGCGVAFFGAFYDSKTLQSLLLLIILYYSTINKPKKKDNPKAKSKQNHSM